MSFAVRSKPHHGQRRGLIVESLLTDIIRGRLHAGVHLVTQELAERFEVSHTPIREALITLAGMGMVDLQPNRGAVVRRLTAQEVHEVCQVRCALECEAARSACSLIDKQELRELAAELRQLLTPPARAAARFIAQARAVDSRFHDLIAASTGNSFLAKELSRLTTLFRAFRDIAWRHDEARNDFHRIAEEAREHLAIVDALLAGDADRASEAMAVHIRSGARYWTRALPQPSHPETVRPGRNGDL